MLEREKNGKGKIKKREQDEHRMNRSISSPGYEFYRPASAAAL
jgi:hypothetical protein